MTLSGNQLKALPLLAAGASYATVSEQVGVAVGTLRNWVSQREPFRAELKRLQLQAYDSANARLQALSELATTSLHDVLADRETPARDRIAAARTVLGLVHDKSKAITIHTTEEASEIIARVLSQLGEQGGQEAL